MRRRSASAAVLLTAALLAGACSSDSKSDPPSSAELGGKLLTAAGLGDGWAEKPPAVDGQEGNTEEQGPDCLKDDPGDPHVGTAKATFAQGTGFPTLDEEIYSYREEDADAAIERAIRRIDDCATFTFTEGALTFDGTLTRISSFPQQGDETAAWQMHFASGNLAFDFVIVDLRKGDLLANVSYGQVAGDPAAALEQATHLAEAALAEL